MARLGTSGAEPALGAESPARDASAGFGGALPGGEALPHRREMEAAFGQSFANVQVRTGRGREMSAIGARAAASGEEVAFAGAHPDRHTVAHELAHVVQHRRYGAGTGGISQPGDAAEHEAEAIAAAVTSGRPVPEVTRPAVTAQAPARPANGHDAASSPDPELSVGLPGTGNRHGGSEPADDPAANARAASTPADAVPPEPPPAHPHPTSGQASPPNPTTSSVSPTHPHPTSGPATADPPPTTGPISEHPHLTTGQASPPSATTGPVSPAHPHPTSDHASPTNPTTDPGSPTHPQPTTGPASPAHPQPATGPASPTHPQAPAHTQPTAGPASPARAPHTDAASAVLGGSAHTLARLDGVKLTSLNATLRDAATSAATVHEHGSAPTPTAPRPHALAPIGPTATHAAPPTVSRTLQRSPKPIEHANHRPPPEQPISAGARPRVPMQGGADPVHADAARQTGHAQLDGRLGTAADRSAGDLGVSRLSAPLAMPPPPVAAPLAPPPIRPPAIAESPWQRLPADARARLDERVAPALEPRIAAMRQRAQADDAESHVELARLRGAHTARVAATTERAQAQVTGLRDTGAARVQSLRGQWHADNLAAKSRAAAQVERDHAGAEAEIQQTVHGGEQRSHAILTGAETSAASRRAAAEARASQIRAEARGRADAAHAAAPATATMSIARQDAGTGADPRAILEAAEAQAATEIREAQAQIDRLMADAGNHSQAEIAAATAAILARLTLVRARLAALVHEALHEHFPELETLYRGQINTLLNDTQRAMLGITSALAAGHADEAAAQLEAERALVARRTQRLQDSLEDAAVLSTFTDIDSALTAFDIDCVSEAGAASWTRQQRGLVLAQAIRMENAFRASDQAGLFAQAGLTAPGAAFDAMMNGGNGLTLRMMSRQTAYTEQQRQDLYNQNPATYNNDPTQVPTTFTDPNKQGGWTKNAGEIDFYTLTSGNSNTWIADATMFHIGHEMGHAFSATMNGANNTLDRVGNADVPYYDENTGVFSGSGITDGRGHTIAGGGASRFVLTSQVLQDMTAQAQADDPQNWRAILAQRVQAASEAQGLRSGTSNISGNTDYLRMLPYQQDATSDGASNASQTNPDSEWWADTYVNWGNGTLADNAAGDAVDGWMDTHMQDWIRMRLEANGDIPPPATPTPTATRTTVP